MRSALRRAAGAFAFVLFEEALADADRQQDFRGVPSPAMA